MLDAFSRRSLLLSSARSSALLGVGGVGVLARLAPVSAAEAALDAKELRIDSGIAPVVRLIETTPRDQLLEEVAARLRSGLSYRSLLAALLVAGVKNVEPRPSVGFKFHAVLVVNSAHLASLSSPPEHRWLPIFWALDYYKSAAARDVEERGDWTMRPVDERAMPSPRKALSEFTVAMDGWDESGADAAVAQLARSAGANQVYEELFRYGMRDFRSIGHKAIYVANSYRTLNCIGWQHAEPVLRSLAYALLMHEGGNPAERSAEADRPYRRNLELIGQLTPDWQAGPGKPQATGDLLAALRSGTNDEACDLVVKLLNAGAGPQAIWDGLHVAAGELLMRQPGIVALHAVTTTNALHFCYRVTGQETTRQLLMLQAAAFLPMFREAMVSRGELKAVTIDDLTPHPVDAADAQAVDGIFQQLTSDPAAAANQLLGYLDSRSESPASANDVITAARVLVFLKGNNAHDYKFSSAMLEDYDHISPGWRNRYMASNIFKLRGAGDPDNELVARIRQALEA